MSLPSIVTYSLTRLCNLKCKHCYSSSGLQGENELSTENAMYVVRQIAEAGSRIIIFDGGEPLMREDIFDLIRSAKTSGLKTVLGTNGTLMTENIASKLVDSGLDICAVSIDGSKAKTHEWLRSVDGCFGRALHGARIIREAGISLQVNTCLNSHNESELQEIVLLAESLKASTLQLLIYTRSGRCEGGIYPPDLKKLEKINSKIPVRIIGAAKVKGSKCCCAGDTVSCILNDGTVYPCMLLPVPAGNVTQNSLHDIWVQSPVIKRINELIKEEQGCELCRNTEKINLSLALLL